MQLKVLVVDNMVDHAIEIANLFQVYGAEADSANCPEAAMAHAFSTQPHLIINGCDTVDWKQGQPIPSWRFWQQLYSIPPGIKDCIIDRFPYCVALTLCRSKRHQALNFENGADVYVEKPIQIEHVLEWMNAAVRRREFQDEWNMSVKER